MQGFHPLLSPLVSRLSEKRGSRGRERPASPCQGRSLWELAPPPPLGRGSRDGGPQEPPGACCMVLGLISTSPTTVMSGVRPQPAGPCAFNPTASPQHLSRTHPAPWPGRCPGRASAQAWWGGFSTRSRCPASCSCPVPLWPPRARALFCSELTSGPLGLLSTRGLERRGWGA